MRHHVEKDFKKAGYKQNPLDKTVFLWFEDLGEEDSYKRLSWCLWTTSVST